MEETQPLLFKKETSFNSSSNSSNGEKVRSYGTTALSGDHGIGDTVSTTNIDIDNTTTTTTTTRTPRATDNNGGSDAQTPSLDIVGLSYSVKERPGHWWNGSCFKPPKKKMVLQNLCLSFQSGQLTGLVGSSGSGKTSLLDVISGRATGKATGVVSYKHEQCTRELMQDSASYVLQADRLLPTLTARETLTFMAYLKLSGKFKAKDIDRKVDSVLQDMGLNKVADTRIGGAVIRGVSGGERRRISIAIQLLKDPEILLLDEPTTGLDALSARNLVKGMADLAHKGRLVLMSIHQPRSDIFALLDKVTLMTIGQLAFFGRPDELVPYFTDIGYPCPKNENPCDIYVDIVSVDRRTPSRERTTLQRAKKICNEYANSDLQSDVLKNITKGLSYHFEESLTPETVDTPSWIRSFHTLLVRMNVHLYRDRGAFLMRIMQTFLSVPFIAVFLGHIKYNQASIQDRLGVTYLALNIPHFMGITSGISNFPVLQNMMYRECHDGLYSIFTFLSAYYVHALPYTIVSVGIYAPALYWISGLNSDFYAFGSFVLVGVLLEHFSEMMAVAMLALFYHPQVAYNTSMLIFTTASLVASGLLRPLDNMPVFFQWSSYIAVTKYATEILVGNEFEGLELTCSNNTDTHQCVEHGEEVLEVYYPDALKNMNQNFAILGGYTFAILIFAWMMFKVRRIPTLY